MGRQHLLDSHRLHLLHELVAEDAIAIPQQIAGHRVPRESFPQLVRRPLRGRMSGDGEMQNASAIVRQNEKDVQNLKADRRHREKIDGNQTLHVIV